jgi:hypothetical protein
MTALASLKVRGVMPRVLYDLYLALRCLQMGCRP